MAQIIDVPGHGPVEFPDEMSDEDIAAVLRKQMAPDPGMRGGIVDALLTGAREPVDELAALVPKGLSYATSLGGRFENPVSRGLAGMSDEARRVNEANEAEYQAARAQQGRSGFDAGRLTGNILSPANLVPATRASGLATRGAQAVGAGSKLAGLAGATAAGATYGVLSPSEDQSLGEKASQALIGAALGPVAEVGAQGVGKLLRPAEREAQNRLIAEGVTLTPGQYIGGMANTLEQKAMSIPFFGDAISGARRKGDVELNRAVANRALAPIGKSLPKDVQPGYEATQYVHKTLSDEYQTLLPKLTFAPDQQLLTDVQKIRQMVDILPEQQAQQFKRIFEDKVVNRMSPYGRMGGESFKKIEADLKTYAQKFLRDPDTNNRDMGAALGELLSSFRSGLIRNNPAQAPKLKAINEGWANYVRLNKAAASRGADEGVFTPAQLRAAVHAEDKTRNKRAFAQGDALMQDLSDDARRVLQSRYPESGTASRLMLGGGLLGSGAISPGIPLAVGAASVPYLLRKPTQAALQGTDALAREMAELASKYGEYGALPALIPLTE